MDAAKELFILHWIKGEDIKIMTSRERVLTSIEHREPDRPPYSFSAMPELYGRLKKDLGVDDAGMRERFGGDIRWVGPEPKAEASEIRYADPTIEVTPDGFYRDIWGVDFRRVEHSTGAYVDLARNPLRDVTSVDELADYHYWPSPDMWDYSTIEGQCIEYADYATIGHTRGFFEISWFMRGMDNFLSDLLIDPGLACGVMDRVLEYLIARMERVLSAANGKLAMFEINDDVGTQNGLLMSPDLWRRYIKPRLRRQVDVCKRYGVKVQYHSCGSVRAIIPDLIEVGIDVLNPVQALAKGMDPFELKREFGSHLTFHGGVDEQELLPHATPGEVRDYVKRLVDVVGADGGLIVAPCHTIQPDTPTENVLAMYETLWELN